MRKVRIGFMILCFVMILIVLFFIDYSDLSWKNNQGEYLGICAMILLIVSLIFSNRHEKQAESRLSEKKDNS